MTQEEWYALAVKLGVYPGNKHIPRIIESDKDASPNDLGEIRPDIDTLLASDSVCLRTSPCLPQSGDMRVP